MPDLQPLDEHNRTLLANVHPPDWVNPQPASDYHLVVIGAGAGGLVSAIGAARLGGRVALVEKNLLGGDCLNVGCVPSKTLIRSARAAADARDAGRFGVRIGGDVSVDFPAVMERVRRVRASISPADGVERLRSEGVDVFLGEGRFTSGDCVEVDGRTLHFRRAIIATGGRPRSPSIPGLADASYLTNETVFNLTELPRRLAIIGAGPIGCEMSQAFARLGAQVHLLEGDHRILGREDADAAEIVLAALRRDGVSVGRGCRVQAVRRDGDERVLTLERDGALDKLRVDQILVSTGRSPNVEGLGLESAGVEYDTKTGVAVDGRLQTSNRRIYAVGDVCFPYKFTHVSDATARLALRNAFFFGRAKTDDLIIPWCTYTDPEVAHVGMYPHDAEKAGIEHETVRVNLSDVDRAVVDGEMEGFLKVLVKRGSDKILGATLVARHAGEMISQITLAMVAGAGLKTIAETIYPYPTQAEAVRKAADERTWSQWSPLFKKSLAAILRWRR